MTSDIDFVEGIIQLPLSVLTFTEEVDFIIDTFIKIDVAANHPTAKFIHPLQKAIHYGVYLTVSYQTCDKCTGKDISEDDSDNHHHKAPLLEIPPIIYEKNIKVDESLNIMHDVYKVHPDMPLVSIGATGLGFLSTEDQKVDIKTNSNI